MQVTLSSVTRGKRTDNGEWVKGLLIRGNGAHGVGFVYLSGQGVEPYILTEPGVVWQQGKYQAVYKECVEVDPKTVGTFSGITDCSGSELFVGDIVRAITVDGVALGVVKFGAHYPTFERKYYGLTWFQIPLDTGFYIHWKVGNNLLNIRQDLHYWEDTMKLVGNCFDNPELLEENKSEC